MAVAKGEWVFGNGDRMRMRDAEIQDRLTSCSVARLATVSPDGRPHQVPIVFVWYQDCFWSPIDGKPKAEVTLQRVRNVQANPSASLLLDEYSDDWQALWWIRADVEVSVMVFSQVDSPEREALASVCRLLETKYPQYGQTDVLREPATMLKLMPKKLTGWRAG